MQNDARLTMDGLVGIARRRLWIIVVGAVIAGLIAFFLSHGRTKQYTSTASILFNQSDISQQVAGLQAVGYNETQAGQDTNVTLVQVGDMASRTAATLGGGLTEQAVKKALSISSVGDTNLVTVKATSPSRTIARKIASTYSNTFVREQQDQNKEYYQQALSDTNRQLAALPASQHNSAAGLTLEQRAQSLAVLADLPSNDVTIAQAATLPNGPSSPRVKRDAVEGAAIGLVLGCLLVLLLEKFDQGVRDANELQRLYDLPLLGVIPLNHEFQKPARAIEAAPQDGFAAIEPEAFQLVLAHLRYFNVDRQVHTLLVTSAVSGDGKSTTVAHLASAAARVGSRVLVVEADLRRPSLSRTLALPPRAGLAEVLIGASSFDDALQNVAVEAPTIASETTSERSFDVLASGFADPPNAAELIESEAMSHLLQDMRERYDFVVVDTPPVTLVSDAFALLARVDGVVVVGRVGHDRRDAVSRARETLAAAEAPLLGIVANGTKAKRSDYYGYSYASAGQPSKPNRVSASAKPRSSATPS